MMHAHANYQSHFPMNTLLNVMLFQGVWFASVLGAANGQAWWSVVSMLVFIAAHFFLASNFKADMRLLGCAMLAGFATEALIVQSGMLSYASSGPWPQLAPVWIVMLWGNFALTLNGCLRWLHGKYALAAILGGLGGALSYWGGIKLGAASAGAPLPVVLAVVAGIYAIATPSLVLAAQRLNRAGSQS